MTFEFLVNESGEREFEDAAKLYFSKMKPGAYSIDINPISKRTNQQNRYYWLRNSVIAVHTGHTKLDIHEALMHRCAFYKEISIGKKVHMVRMSSTELGKDEFSRLFDEQDELVRDLNEDLERPIVLPEILPEPIK